jgi:hypothetical protein
MAFLFQDQNQGIRNDVARAQKCGLSRPFSFIRTLTVGLGITPNLLTLPHRLREALAGLGFVYLYRRWGFSPRPENYRPSGMNGLTPLCRSRAVSARTFGIG